MGRGRFSWACVWVSGSAAARSRSQEQPTLDSLPRWVVHGGCLLVDCESGLRTGLSTVRLMRRPLLPLPTHNPLLQTGLTSFAHPQTGLQDDFMA